MSVVLWLVKGWHVSLLAFSQPKSSRRKACNSLSEGACASPCMLDDCLDSRDLLSPVENADCGIMGLAVNWPLECLLIHPRVSVHLPLLALRVSQECGDFFESLYTGRRLYTEAVVWLDVYRDLWVTVTYGIPEGVRCSGRHVSWMMAQLWLCSPSIFSSSFRLNDCFAAFLN